MKYAFAFTFSLSTLLNASTTFAACSDFAAKVAEPLVFGAYPASSKRTDSENDLVIWPSRGDHFVGYTSDYAISKATVLSSNQILVANEVTQIALLDSKGKETDRDDSGFNPVIWDLYEIRPRVRELIELGNNQVLTVVENRGVDGGPYQSVGLKVYKIAKSKFTVSMGFLADNATYPIEGKGFQSVLRLSNSEALVVLSNQIVLLDLLKSKMSVVLLNDTQDFFGGAFLSQENEVLIKGWSSDHTRQKNNTLKIVRSGSDLKVWRNGLLYSPKEFSALSEGGGTSD